MGAISKEEYIVYRNALNKVIRTSKQNYYVNYFNSFRNSVKNTWLKIKELQKRSSSKRPQTMKINGQDNNNSSDIANAFNHFYAHIAPNLDRKLPTNDRDPLSYLRGNYADSMSVPPVLIHDTIKVINSLKDKMIQNQYQLL